MEGTSTRPGPGTNASVGQWVAYAAVLILVVLASIAGLLIRDVLRIRHDLQSGERQLAHAQLTSIGSAASVDRTFGKADRNLREGARLARTSPWLRVIKVVIPRGTTQLHAVRSLSAAAAEAGDVAFDAAKNVRTAMDRPMATPDDRLQLVDDIRAQVSLADSRLSRINPQVRGRLMRPLAHAHQQFQVDLAKAHRQLTDGLQQIAALRSILAGPRRYLVLAGNNAEMRSGGITTSASVASIGGGDLKIGKFMETSGLFLPPKQSVPPPADLQQLYGWLNVGQDWRTTETSPNWPTVASLYARMSNQTTLGPVDGVIFVDVVALRSLLDVVGSVDVNGVTYTANTIEKEILYDDYLIFQTGVEAPSRRALQSQVAAAAFNALRSKRFSFTRLAHDLSLAAKGRHVLAWSSHPDEEAMWEKAGAGGSICADCFMVSPQNVSANKLDYFIDPKVNIRFARYSEHQDVDLSVTITNPPRAKTSPYIEGGNPGFNQPGDQRVFLLLYLPKSAYGVVNRTPGLVTVGTDGPMGVVGMIYIVPKGQTKAVDIHFSLPVSQQFAYLLPSSRLRPIQITVNGLHLDDAVPRVMPL